MRWLLRINLRLAIVADRIRIGLIIFLGAGSALLPRPGWADEVVATIDSEPISLDEFRLHLNAHRAEVYAYFHSRYGLDDSKNFWHTDCGGLTPLSVIKEKALRELKVIKVQQIAAKEAGVVADISYSGFLRQLEQENARRAAALLKGQVVYGPRSFSEVTFYDYLFSHLIIKLESALSEQTLGITPDGIRLYYERHKEERYRIPDRISAEVVTLKYENATKKAAARKVLAAVRSSAALRKSLAESAAPYLSTEPTLQVATRNFGASTARGDSRATPAVLAATTRLKAGEMSEIIEEGEAFALVKCIARKNGGYKKFEDCRDVVKRAYVEDRYKAFVDARVAKAKVWINKPVYERIEMSAGD